MKDYQKSFELNRKSWDRRTPIHIDSHFYDNIGFFEGRNSLKHIELKLLGNVKGKSILHLQCHFGQDSMSLSRMGAQVTAVDFSESAIQKAKEFSNKLDLDTKFICCNVYDLPNYLNQQFDLVFTSYGVIGWLPDLDKWAKIISHFLKPNGNFIMAEFHPTIWMFDDEIKEVAYSYFNTGAIMEQESGTYANRNANINEKYVMWNHSLSEVLNNLLNHNFRLKKFYEYSYSPYDCFHNCIKIEEEKYQIKHHGDKLPMVFAIKAELNN